MSRGAASGFVLVLTTTALGVCTVAACRDETDLYPASDAVPSAASVERYIRRAYVDLTGAAPDEATLHAARDALLDGNVSPAARVAFAEELVASDGFAQKLADDLRTAAFDGVPAERVFYLYCRASANADGTCETCPFDAADPCTCDCNGPKRLVAERTAIAAFAERIAAGEASSTLEHELAASSIFQAHGGSPEGLAASLFEDFFDRPPEADEIANVRACARGTGVGGMGCTIFRENASNYAELVDRAFASEVYREAAVRRVFRQYLGRLPTPAEYRAFAGALAAPGADAGTSADAAAPFDVRALVIKVVASGEYFELG